MPRILVPVFVVMFACGAADGRAQDVATAADPPAPAAATTGVTPPPAAQPAAFEYSHAYEVRATIHKTASIAMLPLFAAEAIVGQSLYDSPTDSKKTAHVALGAGIGGLFAVTTATGVWNLIESRHDPNERKIRLLHGLMMLGADAGFLATGLTGPDSHGGDLSSGRSTHRAIAFTSMGVATASYLVMLFGNR